MPGRYTLTATKETIEARFNVRMPFDWKPRYNIAPCQEVPIVTNESPGEVTLAKWGLVPSWSETQNGAHKLINARSETISRLKIFKDLFKTRRCLILADGYYEWQQLTSIKQAYYIHINDRKPFAFAGLWDTWTDKISGQELTTFTLITTEPNELIFPIHNRMGVILTADNEKRWLGNADSSLLGQYRANLMNAYMVGKMCGSVKNDRPECLMPEVRLL